ncbi:MAG: GMC oxidoreductase, partial [Candidatus Heimdallarchaeota archaeon]|nr:GMC oxidoreductase [Candidatus Heimdallarchaeota archaeon]
LGCYYDAKQDMRLTYLKDGLEKGLTAFTETKAEKISYTNKDKQVIHARISQQRVGKSDISLKINTKRTVVSASSIFTPLILQKSGLSKGGNVGKYLHVHPTVGTIGIFDDSKSPMYGTPQTIVSKESFKTNTYGYWQEIPDLEPFLLGVNAPFFGEKRREFMKNSDRTVTIITLIRDGKNKKSNGEISWRRGFNSQNGIISLKPLPSIRYKLSMEDRNTLIEGQINAAKILLSTDAKEVITLHNDPIIVNTPNDLDKIKMGNYNPNFVSMFSAHPLSTARMGKNKQLSVINETMEMHHFPGVFVMDGSSIPTALGVNPMITILSCVSKAIELGNINL